MKTERDVTRADRDKLQAENEQLKASQQVCTVANYLYIVIFNGNKKYISVFESIVVHFIYTVHKLHAVM